MDGWTVIDAGLADEPTRGAGVSCARAARRPAITRVIATHYHPDHMGLAGWLCAETGAELWTSRTEWLTARLLAQDTSEEWVAAGRRFDRRAGLDDGADRGARRARQPVPAPRRAAAGVIPPRAGRRPARLADAEWRVLVGRGHAPEMLCLFSPEHNLLIAGDQVLPRISPNVSVWPSEPEANPLAEFLDSLASFGQLPADCLVLPSTACRFAACTSGSIS